ncbi:ligand-binding sensor domain-containing protein [Limnochorda pilosa]|uniref:Uncharacterized protein n=1 Tax=Limnochorda pilosa TaxID=1555112 RepID=A0A0K2SJM4_LIMPI|nr:hypothetical protein [Limnochorda pilosa]BAS27207.1 hypothetical protein LIP_1356 [Limnochorda pilosa]
MTPGWARQVRLLAVALAAALALSALGPASDAGAAGASGGTPGLALPPLAVRSFHAPNDVRALAVRDGWVYLRGGEGGYRFPVRALQGSLDEAVQAVRETTEEAGSPPGLPAAGDRVEGIPYPIADRATLDGATWLATFGGGLWRQAPGRLEQVPGAPAVVQALGIAAGTLVAGTPDGLLLVRAGESGGASAASYRIGRVTWDGLPSDHVAALAYAAGSGGGRLWVGTFDQGVVLYDGGRWRPLPLPEGRARWITALHFDGTALWIGTENGLYRAEDLSVVPALPGVKVQALVGQGGRVRVLTGDGLVEVGPDGVRALPISLGARYQVAASDGRSLWVGGSAGLAAAREEGEPIRSTPASGHIPPAWITAILPRSDGLVVGTYDAGIYAVPDPLGPGGVGSGEAAGPGYRTLVPGVWVNPGALHEQAGFLWAGTLGDGLVALARGAWTSIGPDQGLAGADVTALAGSGRVLWVGTRTGLSRVDLGAEGP